eukprot:353925-Chlamydomonas_euryale.AAC.3
MFWTHGHANVISHLPFVGVRPQHAHVVAVAALLQELVGRCQAGDQLLALAAPRTKAKVCACMMS